MRILSIGSKNLETYGINIGGGEGINGSKDISYILYIAGEEGLLADVGNQTSAGIDIIQNSQFQLFLATGQISTRH